MTLEEAQAGRVIAHVDLDAFYAAVGHTRLLHVCQVLKSTSMLSHAAPQVEVRRAAHLRGLPLAVVQYNPLGDLQSFAPDDPRRHMNHSNGSLIAVGYEARKHGVKRRARYQRVCVRFVDQTPENRKTCSTQSLRCFFFWAGLLLYFTS